MRRLPKSRNGSILLVTVLLATGVALAIGSFITLTVESVNLSNRTFYSNASLDLAEAGLEEAISALNHADWSGWTTDVSGSDNKRKTVGSLDLGQGTVGAITVVVYGVGTSPTPRVVSEGKAFPKIGPPISKQVEIRLHRRSHWATGIVAKDKVTFSGANVYVDSYNSEDPTYSNSDGTYNASKHRDRGSVASATVEETTDGVAISNSDIWGFAATGGSDIDFNPGGTILGVDSPPGTKIDTNRVTKDFSANFEPVAIPSTSGSLANVTVAVGTNQTISAGSYAATSIDVNGSGASHGTLTISGDVTLVVSQYVDIKGSLEILPGSSLTLYVAGDFTAGGNAVANNTGLPKNLVIYGTATSPTAQQFKLNGNGAISAAVYAPNAEIVLDGGGGSGAAWSGSVIGYSVKITGNYQFHYDEALQNYGGGNPFAISRWRELMSASERVTF